MRPEFFYPAKPYRITQGWGIKNPIYQTAGLSFSRHNGEDFALGEDKKIYAPFDCTVVKVFNQRLGGNVVTLVSRNVYQFPDGVSAYVKVDFLHLEKPLVTPWQILGVGDEVAIADNTGELTTGPHTHGQWRRIDITGRDLDSNDANNSFDPTPYWTKFYAVNYKGLLKLWYAIRIQADILFKGRNMK